MPAAAKWMFILALNAVFSGFFGLGITVLNFLWLEYATMRWPTVHYTEDYQAAFALVCTTAVFVLTTLRQVKTRLESKSLRPGELCFILTFIAIIMVALTPVPGSNFPQYLYERNYPAKNNPGKEEAKPPKLKRDYQ